VEGDCPQGICGVANHTLRHVQYIGRFNGRRDTGVHQNRLAIQAAELLQHRGQRQEAEATAAFKSKGLRRQAANWKLKSYKLPRACPHYYCRREADVELKLTDVSIKYHINHWKCQQCRYELGCNSIIVSAIGSRAHTAYKTLYLGWDVNILLFTGWG
jgi:hypothetical protein